MKRNKVSKLKDGLYLIVWKKGKHLYDQCLISTTQGGKKMVSISSFPEGVVPSRNTWKRIRKMKLLIGAQ